MTKKIHKQIKLSRRLQAVASFVTAGSSVADVGTDHGYIPIWLLESGIARCAIAMDIGKGPLQRAKEHIAEYGLSEQIETRLSDGLEKLLPGEADTVVIAGMGGELMLGIIRRGEHVWESVKHWILSPQSEYAQFRYGLEAMGFAIREEKMLCEDGKYYTIIKAERGTMHYEAPFEYRYGRELIRQKHPVLLEYLKKEAQTLQQIKEQLTGKESSGSIKRQQEIEAELNQVRETYDAMQ